MSLIHSFMKSKPKPSAEDQHQESVAEFMETEQEGQASVDVVVPEATLQGQLEELQAKLSNFESANQALLERATTAETALASYVAEAKQAQRKAALSAVLFSDKVDATYEATAALDDNAFQLIVDNFASKVEAKEQDFKEVGETAYSTQPQDKDAELASAVQAKLNKAKRK